MLDQGSWGQERVGGRGQSYRGWEVGIQLGAPGDGRKG